MMMKSLRNLSLPLLILFFVAGCAVPTESATESVPETSAETTSGAADETAIETRTFAHALGETELMGIPEKVVTLEWSYTEGLLALGMQPAGVADIEGYNSWVKIPVALADDVVDVGTRQAPNLELLAQLGPDLIIGPAFRIAEIYDELSEIAPTVAFDAYPTDENTTQFTAVKEAFLTIAELVGREAEGEAVLADMEAHFAAGRAQVEAAGKAGESFVLAQAFGDDTVSIRLFTHNAMTVEIVEQIGLENGWSDEEFQLYGFTTVGIETLPDLGDVNFFYVVQDDNNVFTREAIQPVWESIEFVQNGNAYPLGGETWLFGGPLSAKVLVDIVVEALTGEPVAAVAESAGESGTMERMPAYDTELEGYLPLTSMPALFEIIEETEDTVTVRHLHGETTIPRNPQRVVTEMNTGEILVSLGVMPVGYIAFENQGISPILAEAAPDMTFLPAVDGPNYEQIVALDPDLIIGSWMMGTDGNQEHYELLSEIAPTLPFNDWPGIYWQDSTRQVAELFELEEQAEVVIADYDAHVQEIRAQIAPIFGDDTVTPLLFFGATPWLYTPREARDGRVAPEDSVGWLYHELALTPGPEILELLGGGEEGLGNQFLEIPEELLPEIAADHLVVFPNGYSGAEGISEGYTEFLLLLSDLVGMKEVETILVKKAITQSNQYVSPQL